MARKEIPFVEDKKKNSCQGISCLQMILKYFDKDSNKNKIIRIMGYKIGEWLFPVHLIKCLDKSGINIMYFYGRNLKKITEKDFSNITGKKSSQIYKNDIDIESYNSGVDYALKKCLYKKRTLNINDMIKFLKEGCIIIISVDRNILARKKGEYKGHYTLVIGYDKNGFILNDPFFKRNFHVNYNLFIKAYKNNKNFKDAIVIFGIKNTSS